MGLAREIWWIGKRGIVGVSKRKYLGWEFYVYKEEVFRLGVGLFGDVRILHIPQRGSLG